MHRVQPNPMACSLRPPRISSCCLFRTNTVRRMTPAFRLACKASKEAAYPASSEEPRQLSQPGASQHHAASQTRLISPTRRTVLGMTALAMCACCRDALAAPSQPSAGAGYTYGVQDGPEGWGGTCATGDQQSPVNITTRGMGALEGRKDAMTVDYQSLRRASVKNTGHGAQVNMAAGNVMEVGATKWQLVQYHFHTPSEHALDRRHAPMEAHLVHQDLATGALAVTGVLLEVGRPNSALQQALLAIPDREGATSAATDLSADTLQSLLPPGVGTLGVPADRRGRDPLEYVHYRGSLTTPPCSEVVQWFVLTAPAFVSAEQVLDFQRLLGAERTLDTNSRPVMPLNGRRFDYESVGDRRASDGAKAASTYKPAGSFKAVDGSRADAKAVSDDAPPLYDSASLDILTGRSWGRAR